MPYKVPIVKRIVKEAVAVMLVLVPFRIVWEAMPNRLMEVVPRALEGGSCPTWQAD